jgi:hypothetical protein
MTRFLVSDTRRGITVLYCVASKLRVACSNQAGRSTFANKGFCRHLP